MDQKSETLGKHAGGVWESTQEAWGEQPLLRRGGTRETKTMRFGKHPRNPGAPGENLTNIIS